MPLYDYVCEACDTVTENVLRTIAEKDTRACPDCGTLTRTLVHPVPTVGAVWDKKITIGGLDRTFDTNAELRQWEKDNPDTHIVSRSSSDWDRVRSNARNSAEERVRRWGFRNTHHWSETAKAARAEGKSWTDA